MSGHGGHGDSHAGHEEHKHEESHEEEEHEDEHEESHEEHHESHDEEDSHDDHGHDVHKEVHKEKTIIEKRPKQEKKKSVNEIGVFTLLLVAIILRVTSNYAEIYSVEPIIPLAVYAGLAYGTDAGILIGLLGYPLSNIFLQGGPFGLWSFLQGIGGAIAGWLGGNSRKLTKSALVQYTILGTLIFEVIVNFPSQQLIVWPFSITHIVSNIIYAIIIGELLIKTPNDK